MGQIKKLSDRDRQFVNEYLVDFNAAKAAKRAGHTGQKSKGWQIKRRKAIAAAIEQAIAERSKRTQITADRVLREYARIAFADIRSFAKGQQGVTDLKSVATLTDDEAAAVVELNGIPGKGLKVKLHDKKKALDALARHLGLFTKTQDEAESPSAAAERIRELIRARHARLVEPGGTG
jgi:phage terminase small subunit